MKVIIPVAGYATRLYPLTQNQPKALLDIQGKPILEHIIKKVKDLGVVDCIYIITNEKFYGNFKDWMSHFKSPIKIKLLNDHTKSNEDRKGQIGDIYEVIWTENIDDDILVIAGDNLFNFSLSPIYKFFMAKRKVVNGLYDIKSLRAAQELGNASIDSYGRMVSFEEKPPEPKSTYVSMGIYLLPRDKVRLYSEYLSAGNNPDKMGYFMIWLLDKEEVYGYVYEEKWFDIGWLEALEQTKKEFKG